jgi:hypothetical protein
MLDALPADRLRAGERRRVGQRLGGVYEQIRIPAAAWQRVKSFCMPYPGWLRARAVVRTAACASRRSSSLFRIS